MTWRWSPREVGLVVVLACLAAVVGAVPVHASAAAPPLAPSPRASGPDPARLVVVGVPGLTWSDLARDDLPWLGSMVDEGALGSLTVRAVRSRSCAVDGWLTLSAGRRAADVAEPCRVPSGPDDEGQVPRWGDYLAAADRGGYAARPGLLGSTVAGTGSCLEVVGPGAAIAGADRQGRVATYRTTVPDGFACPVALVDGGVLPSGAAERRDAMTRLDELVGRVLRSGGEGDVVVAGVGDGDSSVRPRAVLATGPSFPQGEITSATTRQPGLAQLQDLTATVLERVGGDVSTLTGRPVESVPTERSVAQRVADRVGFEVRAATLRDLSPQVTGWLAAAFALWCLAVAVCWWRRGGRDPLPRALTAAGVVVASVPLATFVANLVPWWRSGAPAAVFVAVLLAALALLAGSALLAERRRRLGGLLLVAIMTLLVLGGDVLRGSGLQLGSVFGQNPTVGGRFYGFGNTSFALYGLAVLVVVAALAGSRRLGRWRGAALGLAVLVAALGLEALPSLGADLGGPPGLLLGGLLVLATATGLRLTVVRVGLAAVGAAGLVAGVAVLDWLRPAGSRTHLGDFVETVVSGGADEVVGRKVAQNLANLGSPPLLVMAVATVVLVVAASRTGWRPSRSGGVVLRGAVVMALVGFAVNDSGLVIPAFVAVVLTPLLVAAGGRERG